MCTGTFLPHHPLAPPRVLRIARHINQEYLSGSVYNRLAQAFYINLKHNKLEELHEEIFHMAESFNRLEG